MNEKQAKEAQVDGAGSDGPDEQELRQRTLVEFLRKLVEAEGRTRAAEMVGVNYRTLVNAEESGELTGRMSDALELMLLTASGPVEPNQDGKSDRLDRLEAELNALAKELRGGLREIRAAVAGQTEAAGQTQPPAAEAKEEGAGRSETRAAPPVAGLGSKKSFRLRRLEPEVVTAEPAEDDAEVYGAAWPLVEEWRELRTGHPNQGRTLSWLTTEERLLVLELAMLEEHGLTLPPETQALRGFGRNGQTTHRWKALADTRVRLRKRKLLRWVRTVLTLWLWRK